MCAASKPRIGRVSDVDLRLLRVFLAVVRAGGLSAAELELNVGRSTISRHLKDLETRLGASLCRRGRGGFALTEEGRQIHEAAQRLLAALDGFREEVDEVHDRLRGQLNIALFDQATSNPQAHIDDALRRFDDAAPDVRLSIHTAAINHIERGVIDGRYHFGVIPLHRHSASLDYHLLYGEQMLLYCGRGHPLFTRRDAHIDAAQVRAAKYAGNARHSPNLITSHRLGLRRDADAYDQEALAALVLSGRYLGFLPDHFAWPFVESGRMRALLVEPFSYTCEFAAIVRRSPKPSRLVAALLDCFCRAHPSGRWRLRE